MSEESVIATDREGAYSFDTFERVVDAVVEVRPEWAIQHSWAQAEAIMEAGW